MGGIHEMKIKSLFKNENETYCGEMKLKKVSFPEIIEYEKELNDKCKKLKDMSFEMEKHGKGIFDEFMNRSKLLNTINHDIDISYPSSHKKEVGVMYSLPYINKYLGISYYEKVIKNPNELFIISYHKMKDFLYDEKWVLIHKKGFNDNYRKISNNIINDENSFVSEDLTDYSYMKPLGDYYICSREYVKDEKEIIIDYGKGNKGLQINDSKISGYCKGFLNVEIIDNKYVILFEGVDFVYGDSLLRFRPNASHIFPKIEYIPLGEILKHNDYYKEGKKHTFLHKLDYEEIEIINIDYDCYCNNYENTLLRVVLGTFLGSGYYSSFQQSELVIDNKNKCVHLSRSCREKMSISHFLESHAVYYDKEFR